jgi:glucan 1,3-beta-glucosidase
MNDIETIGGLYGLNIGNQQFTMRNIKVSNAVIGISQIWNWGWLYHGITITNCGTAFSMINGQTASQQVGSVTIIDSDISGCGTFVDMVSLTYLMRWSFPY